jgi:hypothetical protein
VRRFSFSHRNTASDYIRLRAKRIRFVIPNDKITRQAMYVQSNAEARSRNNSCEKVGSITYFCVCVGMHARACTWVSGRVDVCMRIRACSLANPACNAYAPYCDVICGPSVSATFFDIVINGAIFGKKVIQHKMCVV